MPATIDAVRVIILFIIPGFICQRAISTTLSRRTQDVSLVIIEAITFSCVVYAVVGWIFFFAPLPSLGILQEHQSVWANIGTGALWIAFYFIVPILLGVGWAKLLHSNLLERILDFLKMPHINPYPRAWDYHFSRQKQAWVVVRLTDNTMLGGYMGPRSFVSSYPDPEDIYIETAYTVDEKGKLSERPAEGNAGVWIQGSQIKSIEFIDLPEEDETDATGKQTQQ
ncbi:MAG TPA: DUF6338 family protein [Ktedonobacterales bacterium]|nr:DUF6338 family protein [Ktedonobacterales bacterium]